MLGGATQRVTSSEIGYAGSPPRELLTRGRSIDSVDRLFQRATARRREPRSASTPRASSALTNLTVDTEASIRHHPHPSSCSNLKDVTPIPPPQGAEAEQGQAPAARNRMRSLRIRAMVQNEEKPAMNRCTHRVRSPKSQRRRAGDGRGEVKTDKHRSYDDAGRDGRRHEREFMNTRLMGPEG